MVGDVDHALHFWDVLLQHGLDPLAVCHVRHAAPLAPAPHAEHHHGVLHVDELYPPAVCSGRLTRNLQRAVAIGSAVMRISSGFIPLVSPPAPREATGGERAV